MYATRRIQSAFGILILIAMLFWWYIASDQPDVHRTVSFLSKINRIRNAASSSSSSLMPLDNLTPLNKYRPNSSHSPIVIAVVTCGMRLQETLNMIKSAIIFNVNGRPLKFIVITEDNLTASFTEKLEDWKIVSRHAFTYQVLPLTFPTQNQDEWRNLFKPCASQRLFLPTLLTDIDSILYVDSDTLFLSPVEQIWHLFSMFNATQIAGLSPEHEDKNVGWYNRFARHPFYGPMGVNSGVMLMNLTRMREFKWVNYIVPLYKEYKLKITWGDQDLINILFFFHPEKLYVFPCEWNYRPDHCMYMSVCKAVNGVKILHGNRGYFHSELQPLFSAIYRIIEQFQLGNDKNLNLLLSLEQGLSDSSVVMSNCGHNIDQILFVARNVLKKNHDYSDYSTQIFSEFIT